VLVANYSNGVVSVHATREDGGIGESLQRHDVGANAHQVVIRAVGAERFVFVPCLGVDHVAQLELDQTTGNLTPNTPPVVTTASGAGPRHLAFAPVANHAYLINELDSTLTALAFDETTGILTPLQTVTTRAAGATGNNTTAEVVVHQSGKFVYGSNRGDDNIVAYAIDEATGMLTLIGHTPTQGTTPRNFTIDPSGRFLYAANQGSDSIVVFAIDQTTGALMPTGATVTVGSPAFIGFAVLPR
jgi:6-phosphogluconolactonase